MTSDPQPIPLAWAEAVAGWDDALSRYQLTVPTSRPLEDREQTRIATALQIAIESDRFQGALKDLGEVWTAINEGGVVFEADFLHNVPALALRDLIETSVNAGIRMAAREQGWEECHSEDWLRTLKTGSFPVSAI